jgi:hypothetical protein
MVGASERSGFWNGSDQGQQAVSDADSHQVQQIIDGQHRVKGSDTDEFLACASGLQVGPLKHATRLVPWGVAGSILCCPAYVTMPACTLLCTLQPKGSSFTGDNKDFYRFKLGSNTVSLC